jgi:signal transduction histidine kinase
MANEIAGELRMKDLERRAYFSIAADLTVNGDEELLQVVMQNLLGNAWKYTGKCAETRIEVGVTEQGGRPAYFVRDNGIGFDKSQAEKMFDAFQRLKNAGEFEGTGIGLATVKRIITRHGGWIACEGEEGKGATFYFSL